MTNAKKPGPGKGPTNMSGGRGASPVLRVRVPSELLSQAEAKAAREQIALPDKVRELLARWVKRRG